MLANARFHHVHAARRGGAQPESDCDAAGVRPNGGAPRRQDHDSGRAAIGTKGGVREGAAGTTDGERQQVQRIPDQRTAGGRREASERIVAGGKCHAVTTIESSGRSEILREAREKADPSTTLGMTEKELAK